MQGMESMQNELDPWDAVAAVRGIRIYVVFIKST